MQEKIVLHQSNKIGLSTGRMPSKVDTASVAVVSVATEPTETMKDMKTASTKIIITEKQSPDPSQQVNSPEDKTVNICEGNLQTSKQTIETTPVLSVNVRNKFQPPPDTYVIYPQYQSYSRPSINAVPIPEATTTLPGQHQDLQCQTQFSPPYQVTYHPPMISCHGNPVGPYGQSYQGNYEFTSQPLPSFADMQFYQFGWQYHSPSPMSPHQPYQDPCQRFNQFQQTGVIPTLRTPYRYATFQEVPNDPAKRHISFKSSHQSDPNGSWFACQKRLEHYCNCECQVKPARQISIAPKEPEKTNRTTIPSTTVESASAKQTSSATSHSTDFTNRLDSMKDLKNPVSDVMQNVSMPRSSIGHTEMAGDKEWYNRETHLSSDSGWISDNSSNKEDVEFVDDVTSLSPVINEISTHFQHSLCLENSTSSNADDCQSSGVSSQCPSMSDDNEHQRSPTKKHPHQPRVMKAIPARFVNLLHAAAENAAVLRKRLEGYPLFRQMSLQRRCEEQQQDQICGSEIQPLQLSISNQPNQSTSWCFPGGYVQFQYHQNPVSYIQGQYPQGAGTCAQGLYHQGGSGCYTQDQFQQSPGGYMQNNYNKGSGSYIESQYSQGSSGYTCTDHPCGQEYCPAIPTVPLYVIQVDNPGVANSCTMYSEGHGYNGSSSQAVY